jgi:cytochrome c oxidase cbb3-type subunit 1
MNLAVHHTHFTVGHSHLAAVGFVSFLIWGSVYGLLLRVTGREPNVDLVGVHFWLSLAGLTAMVISLSIAGIEQGDAWNSGRPFVESLQRAAPLWVWRSVAGTFMALGHVIFAWNLWSMRPGAFVNLMQPPPEPARA